MSKKLPPPSSSVTSGSTNGRTYEVLQAQTLTSHQPDPIAWSTSQSYRRCPYRSLHHQSGTIGTFTVRLLEGQNLIRSHWSVLGLGPVRHLGLSRAVGEVSSFVELGLRWSSEEEEGKDYYRMRQEEHENVMNTSVPNLAEGAEAASGGAAPAAAAVSSSSAEGTNGGVLNTNVSSANDTPVLSEVNSEEDMDRKPAALPTPTRSNSCANGSNSSKNANAATTALAPTADLMSMSLRDAAKTLPNNAQNAILYDQDVDDRKMPASSDGMNNENLERMHDLDAERSTVQNASNANGGNNRNVHRSSTVRQNSNPIWPTSQQHGNRSLFKMRLAKRKRPRNGGGADGGGGGTNDERKSNLNSNTDGQRIKLVVTVKEELTGIERSVPDPFGLGLTKGGSGGSRDGTIGIGEIDVTELALGESVWNDHDGGGVGGGGGGTDNGAGVIDVWATLTLPSEGRGRAMAAAAGATAAASSSSENVASDMDANSSSRCTGRVRVLVSYEPYGMTPRRGDRVALECFARRDPAKSSCRLLIPPLAPLRVLEVIKSHCLVEYEYPSSKLDTLTSRDRMTQYTQSEDGNGGSKDSRNEGKGRRVGTARIHQNCVFVIERTNAVDSAVNLALTPVDAVLSTPLGRATSQIAAPIIGAAGDLVAPAMLTGRIMLASVNTVGAAGLSGAGAVVSTVARSIDPNRSNKLEEGDPLAHHELGRTM